MPDTWHIADARANFDEVMRRALGGEPQRVRHVDGGEVAIVAQSDLPGDAPTLKAFLLAGGPGADDDDSFDLMLREIRESGLTVSGLVEGPEGR